MEHYLENVLEFRWRCVRINHYALPYTYVYLEDKNQNWLNALSLPWSFCGSTRTKSFWELGRDLRGGCPFSCRCNQVTGQELATKAAAGGSAHRGTRKNWGCRALCEMLWEGRKGLGHKGVLTSRTGCWQLGCLSVVSRAAPGLLHGALFALSAILFLRLPLTAGYSLLLVNISSVCTLTRHASFQSSVLLAELWWRKQKWGRVWAF